MAYTPQVNGPALISVGPSGYGSASLQPLGFTEGGPYIAIDYHKEGIIADTGGPYIPVDYQKMGKTAKIQLALVIYDDAVLRTYIEANQSGTTEGTEPEFGRLMFGTGGGFRLVISSPIEGAPWRFGYCSTDYSRLRPGTKYKIYDIGIDAIPYIGNSATPLDTRLYDRTAA